MSDNNFPGFAPDLYIYEEADELPENYDHLVGTFDKPLAWTSFKFKKPGLWALRWKRWKLSWSYLLREPYDVDANKKLAERILQLTEEIDRCRAG